MEAIGKINQYGCQQCREIVATTLNLNKGTTPFGINCPKCKGYKCYSNFYKILTRHSTIQLTVTHLFYRPTLEGLRKLGKDWYPHVLNGGLVLCPIGDFPGCLNLEPPDDYESFITWSCTQYAITREEFQKAVRGG